MGRNPIKENQNPYFRARKQAAEWDARLESRERASELIGIAAYTLADYELGNVKRVPADKVLIMADLYNAPWLLSNYCKNECPICGFLPLATEEKNICSVTVRLLKALREDELENMKNQLLEISQDGKIRDDEVEAVRKISEYLDGIAEVISEFKIMSDEIVNVKYPNGNAPSLVYTNDKTTINVALVMNDVTMKNNQIEEYVKTMESTYKNYSKDVKLNFWERNNHKIGEMEFTTQGSDTEIYNHIITFSVNDKLRLVNFNCTKEQMSEWREVSKFIVDSIMFE